MTSKLGSTKLTTEKILICESEMEPNPDVPALILPVELGTRRVWLIQEGQLLCGTKQRVLPLLLAESKPELVYTGATSGAAQVLVAYAAKLSRKKATLFVGTYEGEPEHPMLRRARALGARLK